MDPHTEPEDKKFVGVIDMTPTWSGILPLLLMSLESPNAETRKNGIAEITRMAKIADAYVTMTKGDPAA